MSLRVHAYQFESPLLMGVDPGLMGSVAVYNYRSKKLEGLFDIPAVKKASNGKLKTSIDASELAARLEPFRDRIHGALIERVGAAPGQGVVSMFSFGFSTGVITGIIAALGARIETVPPSVWKLNLGLSSDKKLSLELAKKTFPESAKLFARAKDDGRAEAALLARYGERIFCVG